MAEKITSRFMIQIAGKPVENVSKALEAVLGKLKEEKVRFKVVDSDIIEPELDEATSLYSGIIEVSAEFDSAEKVMEFILDYTPNSVEVEDPAKIIIEASELTAVLNDMSSYLLGAQSQIRKLNAHIHMLNSKIKELESKK